MNIEISHISNKNAKIIFGIVLALIAVLAIIQLFVSTNKLPVVSKVEEPEMVKESWEDSVSEEFSGTIILVNNELSFIRLVSKDNITRSIGFNNKTEVNFAQNKTTLEPFTKATVVVKKFPQSEHTKSEMYQYMAQSISVLGDIELRNETLERQDTTN